MAQKTAADVLVETFIAWDVEVIFGLPGDGINGLYDAKLDGPPVLAITGHHFHDLIDTKAQQNINLDRVFLDVAVYNTRVMDPGHIGPVDTQSLPVDSAAHSMRFRPGFASTDTVAHAARLPDETDLDRAAQVLNAGKRVAISTVAVDRVKEMV